MLWRRNIYFYRLPGVYTCKQEAEDGDGGAGLHEPGLDVPGRGQPRLHAGQPQPDGVPQVWRPPARHAYAARTSG